MLVLTRKKNEIFHIGLGISIKVIRVSGNKVRLGITAPRDLCVKRTELPAATTIQLDDEVANVEAGTEFLIAGTPEPESS